MELYSYFRSSASFRVRIALGLKGLPYDYLPVQIVKNEQFQEPFDALAPAHLVPLLRDGDAVLSQSMAIIEYLDETHPEPPLLPGGAVDRARIRALAQDIACEIHPLNNLRVLRYLVKDLGVSEDDKNRWYRHWVETGLEAVERQMVRTGAAGRYCYGDTPTLADCLLVPQIFNAQRLDCRTDHVPRVMAAFAACMRLEAFQKAQPSACPDAA
jgi:maleylacetoacetate isomerase